MTEMVTIETKISQFSPYRDAVFIEHKTNCFCHIPHSQIEDYDEVVLATAEKTGEVIELVIPRWLAKKEELI